MLKKLLKNGWDVVGYAGNHTLLLAKGNLRSVYHIDKEEVISEYEVKAKPVQMTEDDPI